MHLVMPCFLPGLGGLLPVSTVGAWTSEMGRQACSVLGCVPSRGPLETLQDCPVQGGALWPGKMPKNGAPGRVRRTCSKTWELCSCNPPMRPSPFLPSSLAELGPEPPAAPCPGAWSDHGTPLFPPGATKDSQTASLASLPKDVMVFDKPVRPFTGMGPSRKLLLLGRHFLCWWNVRDGDCFPAHQRGRHRALRVKACCSGRFLQFPFRCPGLSTSLIHSGALRWLLSSRFHSEFGIELLHCAL